MSTLERALRYLRTLSYLKPWQVIGRTQAAARRRLGLHRRLPDAPDHLTGELRYKTPFLGHARRNTSAALQQGTFCFLNRPEQLGWLPDWNATELPLLWRFNLHYFEYLPVLDAKAQETICRSWVNDHPFNGIGWHPYPTSLRIVQWIKAGIEAPDLLANLYRQAAHLYRNVETYVYGNHLLENARALIFAGRFFRGQGESGRWLDRGMEILEKETREQILRDGGHFERSPMYHAIMLELYVDVANILSVDGGPDTEIRLTVERMCRFLRAMTHPDGKIALFNDATHEIASKPDLLLAYAEAVTGALPTGESSFPDTGYFVHRDADLYLVIDGGTAGPRYLMAHAHADIFSYELSLGGHQFVTDTGVYQYEAGAHRNADRSTRAHNTLTVDRQDQIECWDSFRVGRRAAPENVRFMREPRNSWFCGEFAGYQQSVGDEIIHRRTIKVDADDRTVTFEDQISGRGSHLVESRIHLHPEVQVTGSSPITLRRGDQSCVVEVEDGEVRWDEGAYHPEFGLAFPRPVLVVWRDGQLPANLRYVIRY